MAIPVTYICLFFLPALFFIIYISGFSKTRAHYFLAVYPFIAVIVGATLQTVITTCKLTKSDILNFSLRESKRLIGVMIVAVVFLIPFFLSLRAAARFILPDTRVTLYAKLKNIVTPEDMFIYNSSDIAQVVKKFANDKKKGTFTTYTQGKKGYIILSYSSEEVLGNPESEMYAQKFATYAKETFKFYPTQKNGPYVIMYRFDESTPQSVK